MKSLSPARFWALIFCVMLMLITAVQPAAAASARVEDDTRTRSSVSTSDVKVGTTGAGGAVTDSVIQTLTNANGTIVAGSQPVVLSEASYPLGESFVYDVSVVANTAFRDEQGNRNTPADQNNEIPRHQREADLVRSSTEAKIEITALTSLDGSTLPPVQPTTTQGSSVDQCVAAEDKDSVGNRIRMDLDGVDIAAIELAGPASSVTHVYLYSPRGNDSRDFRVEGNRIILEQPDTGVINVFVYMKSGTTTGLVGYCTSIGGSAARLSGTSTARTQSCVAAEDKDSAGNRIRMDLDGVDVAAVDLAGPASSVTHVYVYSPRGNDSRDFRVEGNRVILAEPDTGVRNVFVYMTSGTNTALVGFCPSLTATTGGTTGGTSGVAGAQWLRFQVIQGEVKTYENTDSNQNFNNLNLNQLSFGAPDSTERFNALPPLFVLRAKDGTINEIRHASSDSGAHVQMSAELLEEFLFRVTGQADYTTQESTLQGSQTGQYQLRRSSTNNAGIVVTRNVINAPTGPTESRSQSAKILVDENGTVAGVNATATYSNVNEQPAADWAMPTDGRSRTETSALSTRSRSDLSASIEGVYSVAQSTIDTNNATVNSGGMLSKTLDEATSAALEEQIKDEGADELMNHALAEFNRAPEHHDTLYLMVLAADAAPHRAQELANASVSSTQAGAAAVAAALAAASHEPKVQDALGWMISGNHGMARARRVGAMMSAATVAQPKPVLVDAARTFTINETNQANKSAITSAVNTPVLVWGALVDRANYGSSQFDSYVVSRSSVAGADERQALKTAVTNAGSNVTVQDLSNARLGNTVPKLADLFDDGGIDWSYSGGTDFASASMAAKIGRFNEGDNGVWLGATAHLDVSYKDKSVQVFNFAAYTGLDLVDEIPADNFAGFGQIEREFVFKFSALNKQIIDERKAVKCGIGANGDLLAGIKNKDGDPLFQFSPPPFDKSFQVGPVTVSVIAQVSAGLVAPWAISADFCDALLSTNMWYDPDVKKNNGGVWPADYEGQPAAAVGQIALSLGLGGQLSGRVGAAIGLPVLRGGIELSGTLFGIQVPLGVSLQLLDKGNQTHLTGDGYSLANFKAVVQPCYAGNIHITVLEMSLYAFLEWRLPPIINRWKRLWEGKVPKNGELFEVEVKPIPLFNSECSPVAARPLVVVEGASLEGRFSGPKYNGTPIGQDPSPERKVKAALDWYCKQQGYPRGHRTYTESPTRSAVTFMNSQGQWITIPRVAGGFHPDPGQPSVENQQVQTVDCLLGSGGNSGQVGPCNSTDFNNWTLVFSGAEGAHVNLNSGKVAAGAGDDGVDLSANTWYRACVSDGSNARRARTAKTLKKVKVNKPDTVIAVLAGMGITNHQACIDGLVDTPGNYEIEDCGQFVVGQPDIAVVVELTEQGKSNPSGSTAASPGPNVGVGTHQLRVKLTNTGLLDLDGWSASASDGVMIDCPVGKISSNATVTCTGTVAATNDGAISHKIFVDGSYTEPDSDPKVYTSEADWYFTNQGVKANALDVSLKVVGTTMSGSVGTQGNPVVLTGDLVEVEWTIRNNTGAALTNVQMRGVGNLAGDSRAGLCKVTNIAHGSTGKCQTSLAPIGLIDGTPALLSTSIELQATEGTLVKDVSGWVMKGNVVPNATPAKLQIGKITTNTASGPSVTHRVEAEITNSGGSQLNGLKVTSSPVQALACTKTSLLPGETTTCSQGFNMASLQAGQNVTMRASATGVAEVTKAWALPGGVSITGVSINGVAGSLSAPNMIRGSDYNDVGLIVTNSSNAAVNVSFPSNFTLTHGREILARTDRIACEGVRGPSARTIAAGQSIECVVEVWLYEGEESAQLNASVTVNGSPTAVDIALEKAPSALVIMGDSFASGEAGRWSGNSVTVAGDRQGTDRAARPSGLYFTYNPTLVYGDTYVDGANNCHRSDVGDLHVTSNVDERINLACSGAVTADVRDDVALTSYNAIRDGSSQVTRLRAAMQTHDVDMIVLSIGGNDLEFEGIIKACMLSFANPASDCNQVQEQQLRGLLRRAMPDLAATIQNIHEAMADVGDTDYRLVIQGNASPIPRQIRFNATQRALNGCPFSDADAAWARDVVTDLLGSEMRRVALANNANFLDLGDLFEGREVCATGAQHGSNRATAEWSRFIGTGLSQGHLRESMHPNALGQEAMTNCINEMYNRPAGNYRCTNVAGQGPDQVRLSNG